VVIVVVNVFLKKSDKIPQKEIDLALKRKKEFEGDVV